MKLRFSIRDLLWLTALCAVLVAWWLDHRNAAPLRETHARFLNWQQQPMPPGSYIDDIATPEEWQAVYFQIKELVKSENQRLKELRKTQK